METRRERIRDERTRKLHGLWLDAPDQKEEDIGALASVGHRIALKANTSGVSAAPAQ